MTFTFDLSTLDIVTKLRILIRDKDSANILFEDEELQMFLDSQSNDLYLSAADALVALSSNAALLNKAEQIGEYKIDSKGMAEALLKVAARFRTLVEEAPAIDVAELNLGAFSEAEIIWNDLLRTS